MKKMLKRKHLPAWIGILLLSGMFLMGQDSWSPTECIDNDGDGYGNPASSAVSSQDLSPFSSPFIIPVIEVG